jgi:hypothetical protein
MLGKQEVSMALILGLLLAVGGEAAVQPEQAADPVICRSESETGSRLKSRKICMTKSEWAAKRREDRLAVEQAQTARATNDQ